MSDDLSAPGPGAGDPEVILTLGGWAGALDNLCHHAHLGVTWPPLVI